MILRDANKLILLIWNFAATFCAGQDLYAEGRNMEPDTRTSISAVRYHYFPRVDRNSNQLLGPQPHMGRSVGYYWDGHQYRYFQNSLASDFGEDDDFNWGTAPLLKNNVGTGELDKAENSTITEGSKVGNVTSDDEKESETSTGKTTTSDLKSKTGKIEKTSASTKASLHSTTSTKKATDSSTTTTEPSTTTSTEGSTTTTDLPRTTKESTITTSATTTTTPTTTPDTTTTTSTTTTPTTTPTTAPSTATTTTATVIPVVPPRDLNVGRCTPKNAPGIGKNGQCSSTADLSRNCATLQITTSSDCGDYPGKWCCYSGKTKQAGTGGFVKCSPDSLPSVGKNGRCTSTQNLDSHCVNLDIAASVKDCGDFDGKWCCYLSPDDQVPTDSCGTKGPYSAQVVFEEGDIKGSLSFEQTATGSLTKVTGQINGLPASSVLGIVVHSIGDTTGGCSNVGEHYNPQNIPHGELTSMIRHAGDLGNIQSDGNGIATVSLSSNKLQLVGPWSVVGRSLVIHANRDDGGGGSDDSLLTGSVGSPIVCGIIGQRTL